jgi:hypothetical protein
VPRNLTSWNGQAIDGTLSLTWDDDAVWQVAVDTRVRTNMGIAPIRTVWGEPDTVALLGALWGEPSRHRVRETGGHGYGEVGSSVIGSQFRPSAVDWGGKTVRMRVMLADVADASAWLASFAHEPVVRVGAYAE